MRTRSPEECVQLLHRNHSVIPGNGFVMSVRQEHDPSPEHADDESYELFSVQLDTAEFDTSIALESPRVRIYYTRGANAWIGRCAGEVGWLATGHLILRRADGGTVLADIDAMIRIVDAYSGEGGDRAIRREVLLRPRVN
jgi:hypothetical protein